VVAEGLEHKIQLVAEGGAKVDEKLKRFRQEVYLQNERLKKRQPLEVITLSIDEKPGV